MQVSIKLSIPPVCRVFFIIPLSIYLFESCTFVENISVMTIFVLVWMKNLIICVWPIFLFPLASEISLVG